MGKDPEKNRPGSIPPKFEEPIRELKEGMKEVTAAVAVDLSGFVRNSHLQKTSHQLFLSIRSLRRNLPNVIISYIAQSLAV